MSRYEYPTRQLADDVASLLKFEGYTADVVQFENMGTAAHVLTNAPSTAISRIGFEIAQRTGGTNLEFPRPLGAC